MGFVFASGEPPAQTLVIDVTDYGATGDGVTNDTAAIQAAVDNLQIRIATTAPTSVGGHVLTFGSNLTAAMAARINDYYQYPGITNLTDPATIVNGKAQGATAGATVDIENIDPDSVVGTVETGDIIQFGFPERGVIWFPPGRYLVNAPITFNLGAEQIEFAGAPGVAITGSVNGAILSRDWNAVVGPLAANITIRNLTIINTYATGKGIACHSAIIAKIQNCYVSAHIGIEIWGTQCATVDTCQLYWHSSTTQLNSIGISCGNANTIINCDVTGGWYHGIRMGGSGLVVIGGRHENSNDAAIHLGSDYTGAANTCANILISGVSMEDNETCIYVRNGSGITITGIGAGNATGRDYGLRVASCTNLNVSGCNFSSSGGGYGVAGVSIEGGDYIVMTSVITGLWNIATGLTNYQLINCNNPLITVAKLPTTAPVGTIFGVTDATVTTEGTTVAGGGSNDVAVVRTAGVWRII